MVEWLIAPTTTTGHKQADVVDEKKTRSVRFLAILINPMACRTALGKPSARVESAGLCTRVPLFWWKQKCNLGSTHYRRAKTLQSHHSSRASPACDNMCLFMRAPSRLLLQQDKFGHLSIKSCDEGRVIAGFQYVYGGGGGST